MVKCFLSLPITFLTPTSFALLAERPIANVVKLIQAINKTPAAMLNNIQIFFGSPVRQNHQIFLYLYVLLLMTANRIEQAGYFLPIYILYLLILFPPLDNIYDGKLRAS